MDTEWDTECCTRPPLIARGEYLDECTGYPLPNGYDRTPVPRPVLSSTCYYLITPV